MVSRLNTKNWICHNYKLYEQNRIQKYFIYKYSNPEKLNQNTHIKNQKSTRSKHIETKVYKPIPNKSTESCGQK